MEFKTNTTNVMSVIAVMVITLAVVIPIVSAAETISGDKVEFSNDFGLAHEEYYHLTDRLTMTSDGSSATIDGHSITYDTQFRVLVATDMFYLIGNATGNTIFRYEESADDTPARISYSGVITVTCENGKYTITSNQGVHEGTYSFIYAACPKEIADTCTIRPNAMPTHYLPANYELYFMSDVPQTGYMIYDGTVKTLTGTGEVTFTKGELVEDTTDVYINSTMNISFNGVDANIAVVFVPLTVEGHSNSGVLYTVVGIMPVVLIATIIVALAATFVYKRN